MVEQESSNIFYRVRSQEAKILFTASRDTAVTYGYEISQATCLIDMNLLTFDQRGGSLSTNGLTLPERCKCQTELSPVCGTVHFDTAHRVQRPRLYAVCPCTCACTSPRVSRSVRRTPARGVAAPASPRSERRLRCNETCKRCTVYAAASSIVLHSCAVPVGACPCSPALLLTRHRPWFVAS